MRVVEILRPESTFFPRRSSHSQRNISIPERSSFITSTGAVRVGATLNRGLDRISFLCKFE